MSPEQIRNLHRRAITLCGDGGWRRAVPILRDLVSHEPANTALRNNLGLALWQSGDLEGAENVLSEAVESDDAQPAVWLHYGEVLCALREWKRCAEALERGMPGASGEYRILCQSKLALALTNGGRLAASEREWRKILRRQPWNVLAWNGLATAQRKLGKNRASLASLNRLVRLDSCPAHFHSNLLLTLLGSPAEPRRVFSAHMNWARRHAEPAQVPLLPRAPDRNFRFRVPRSRRIRVGYVSADLRDHPVRFFIEPVLKHHDRSRFDVHVFSAQTQDDETTGRLRRLVSGPGKVAKSGFAFWHDIHSMDDHAAAGLVRKLGIDILVDLSGHTAGHRLGVFAMKPAPVQVTYLGYPATTGMKAIDYRLTDSFTDPPGKTERLHSETLLRVDPCFLAYAPPADAPPPFRERRRHIAFGCFSGLAKIGPRVIRVWSRILDAVSGSVLVLKSGVFDDPESEADALKRLAGYGLPINRLRRFSGDKLRSEHLSRYSGIDVALDTFPYSGTTTTCEALWMGVPVVTLCGPTHVSRVSGSILSQMGLDRWIAQTESQYVEKAIGLAQSGEFRTPHRLRLRDQMAGSPMLDHPRHAAAVEFALTHAPAARRNS